MMKILLCTIYAILLTTALPTTAQEIWFDRTPPPAIIVRSEPAFELRIYEFQPLVFQGRIDPTFATVVPPNAPAEQPTREIRLAAPANTVSPFTQLTPTNLSQFSKLTMSGNIQLTPLK